MEDEYSRLRGFHPSRREKSLDSDASDDSSRAGELWVEGEIRGISNACDEPQKWTSH
jgi:hypothetical protein